MESDGYKETANVLKKDLNFGTNFCSVADLLAATGMHECGHAKEEEHFSWKRIFVMLQT